MCVAVYNIARRLGIQDQLDTPELNISVADNANLQPMGAAFLNLLSPARNNSKQMVYFAQGIKDFYLSNSACRDLQLVPEDFPSISPSPSVLNSSWH